MNYIQHQVGICTCDAHFLSKIIPRFFRANYYKSAHVENALCLTVIKIFFF